MATNSINPDDIVEIDYAKYNEAVQKLQSTVYRRGDACGCLDRIRKREFMGLGTQLMRRLKIGAPPWRNGSIDCVVMM